MIVSGSANKYDKYNYYVIVCPADYKLRTGVCKRMRNTTATMHVLRCCSL